MRKGELILPVMMTLLLGSAVLAGDDWPKWRGPDGDGIVKDADIVQHWPDEGPRRLWQIPVGEGYSSPVARDGVVYLFAQQGKSDTLFAVGADDRRPVWPPKSYPTTWDNRKYPGARGTPTIEGERIYTFGAAGDLTCWNLADGAILWKTNVLDKTGSTPITWGSACSPLVDAKRVYVQCGKGGPTAVAVDKTNGAIVWRSEAKSFAGYSTIVPTEVDGREMLLVFGGVEIVAMNPADGKTLWTVGHQTNYDVNAITPIVRNGLAFFTSGYGRGRSTMLRLDRTEPQVVWETTDPRSRYVTPILDGDVMYINDRGALTCVRWADGKQLWTCDDKRLQLGIGGSMVRAGDLLITLSERGMLSLVTATPDGFEFRGQTRLLNQSNTWSTPMIYDGKLYVKGNRELVCLDIAADKS